MSEYPKGVTTNDGMRMYFKNKEEEFAAYLKEPRMFANKPEGFSESIIADKPIEATSEEVIAPEIVHELMKEVVEETLVESVPSEYRKTEKNPADSEEKRKPGRPPKKRW